MSFKKTQLQTFPNSRRPTFGRRMLRRCSPVLLGLLVGACTHAPEELEQVRPDHVEIRVGETFELQYYVWGYAESNGYVRFVTIADQTVGRFPGSHGAAFISTSEDPTIVRIRDLTVQGMAPGTTRVHIGLDRGAGSRSDGDWAEIVVLPER